MKYITLQILPKLLFMDERIGCPSQALPFHVHLTVDTSVDCILIVIS